MKQRIALSGTTAILLALTSTAHADVTAADVWNNWKTSAESVGQTLTPGAEMQDGGNLTLTDLAISMETPEASASGTIGAVKFTDLGNGSVEITMSPSYDMDINLDIDGDAVEIGLTIGQDGMSMIASGDPDAIAYEIAAPAMVFDLNSFVVDGEALEFGGDITLADVAGKYLVTTGDMTTIDTSMTAASMVIAATAKEPDGGDGTFVTNLNYADVSVSTNGSLVMMADPSAMAAMLEAGFATDTKLAHGAAAFDVDFQDGSDTFAMTGSADTGALNFSMDADGLGYELGNTGLQFALSGSEIPLPEIAASMGEIGFGLLMPISQSDDPGDFAMKWTLRDLSVSDMIWSMIDSAGQLPHDPATLIVDLTGKANWLVDIFDEDGFDNVAMPGQVHALDINAVQLTIAGADMTGSGAFTFDNNDLASFDGIPAPTGTLDMKLVGGNGLMDKLVGMGLLPEEQAMGARMMLGIFARPGDGDDTLVSKIEVDGASGSVSANGQRLK